MVATFMEFLLYEIEHGDIELLNVDFFTMLCWFHVCDMIKSNLEKGTQHDQTLTF